MRNIVFACQRSRTTFQKGSADGVSLRLVFVTDLFQGFLEQIANDDSLTNMEISKRIEMNPFWLAQIFVRARIEAFPGMKGRFVDKLFDCPPAIHDRAL